MLALSHLLTSPKNVAAGTTALKKCKPLMEKHSSLKISNFMQHAGVIPSLHTTVALFCHPNRQIYLIDVERPLMVAKFWVFHQRLKVPEHIDLYRTDRAPS